jgi:hypothetical protein
LIEQVMALMMREQQGWPYLAAQAQLNLDDE